MIMLSGLIPAVTLMQEMNRHRAFLAHLKGSPDAVQFSVLVGSSVFGRIFAKEDNADDWGTIRTMLLRAAEKDIARIESELRALGIDPTPAEAGPPEKKTVDLPFSQDDFLARRVRDC